ncbi:MAG: 30S ribosomal protein S16 [Actinomycetota bacterium]
MVRIRLMRVGKRKQPAYRVVVADGRSPRDGRIIEAIGHYQPRAEPSVIDIDNERALYWLKQGAQPSDPVRKLLKISGAYAELTGEAPPPVPEPTAKKTVKATPAASVAAEEEGTAEKQGEDDVAEPAAEDEAPEEEGTEEAEDR